MTPLNPSATPNTMPQSAPNKSTTAKTAAAKTATAPQDIVFDVKNLSLSYGEKRVLKNISVPIYARQCSAIVGASGCGKSSFLRQLNRTNDFLPNARSTGDVWHKGQNIMSPKYNVMHLRTKVGMVFQKPNPFPKSIYNNIIWGAALHKKIPNPDALVKNTLQYVGLWEDVKDHLRESALKLSGGQQQRLCIARALAVEPEVILMDEPCSALDVKSTTKIEQLILNLKQKYSIVIVTHNLPQAKRIADATHFYHKGSLVEWGPTVELFQNPKKKKTQKYLSAH